MGNIARKATDSSVVAAFAYSEDSRELDVEFRSGTVYRYFDVPPAVAQQLLAADSKGRFFGRSIRGQYRYERID